MVTTLLERWKCKLNAKGIAMIDCCQGILYTGGYRNGSRVELSLEFWLKHTATTESQSIVVAIAQRDMPILLAQLPAPAVDRGAKHPKRPLETYFRGRSGLMRIFAGYTCAGRAISSLHELGQAMNGASVSAICLVALFDGVFEAVQNRAPLNGIGTVSTLDEATLLSIREELELFADEVVPKELRRAIVGRSDAIELLRRMIVRAARFDDHVLVRGESGTGKELVAEWVHRLSPRRLKPLIPVNCAAVPKTLAESAFFGHKKGAFTGANVDQKGFFESAGDGSVMLDEIGDLQKLNQVKLFRFLDNGGFLPVGQAELEQSKARIIAATSRPLEVMVQRGQLRAELYYRLTLSNTLQTPALRTRLDDVPLIADHLWGIVTRKSAPPLTDKVKTVLRNHSWPGNVRQLKGFLKRLYFRFDRRPLDHHFVADEMATRLCFNA